MAVEFVELETYPPCTKLYLMKSIHIMRVLIDELHRCIAKRIDLSHRIPKQFDDELFCDYAQMQHKSYEWFSDVLWYYGQTIHQLALHTEAQESMWDHLISIHNRPYIGQMVIALDARSAKSRHLGVGQFRATDVLLSQEDVDDIKAGRPFERDRHSDNGGPPPVLPRYILVNLDGNDTAWENCTLYRIPMWNELHRSLGQWARIRDMERDLIGFVNVE